MLRLHVLVVILGLITQTQAQSNSIAVKLKIDSVLTVIDSYRGYPGDYTANMQISYYDEKTLEKENTFQMWIREGEGDKERDVLLKYLTPANERDNLILSKDNRLWVNNKKTSRPIPISNSQRLLGDASVGDVVNISLRGKYAGSLSEDSSGIIADLKSTSADAIYSRIQIVVDRASLRPEKAAFYTAGGKLIKTAYYVRYQKFSGKSIQSDIVIQDAINSKKVTKIAFTTFKAEKIPRSWFEKENLPSLTFK